MRQRAFAYVNYRPRKEVRVYKLISSLAILSLLTACGGQGSNSANDAKLKELCPLIQEAWTTYSERELDKTNLDILSASWYLVKTDIEEIAKIDAQYEKYVSGASSAFNGNYSSKDFKDLLAFCEIPNQE